MRRTNQIDITSEQADSLVNELLAIEHWDAYYIRHSTPEWYETVAYISRQRRRNNIVRQLLGSVLSEEENKDD
jgi:hypothetical protein